MANPETAPSPVLMRAIAAADVEILRELMRLMCESSTQCATLASQRLLISKGELMLISSDEEDEENFDEDTNEDEDHDKGKDSSRNLKMNKDNLSQPATESRSAKRRKLGTTAVAAQLISRYEMCDTCEKRFDITLNEPSACRVHNGVLEVDYESSVWEDADDDDHYGGEIDPETDERVDSHPEGFKWSCCEEQADAEPCQVSRHVVAKKD